jgi:hypothetical protein
MGISAAVGFTLAGEGLGIREPAHLLQRRGKPVAPGAQQQPAVWE